MNDKNDKLFLFKTDKLHSKLFITSKCTRRCEDCLNTKPEVLDTFKCINLFDFQIRHYESITITGGEPFIDLNLLNVLLSTVPRTTKVYVRTNLDIIPDFHIIEQINGLNIEFNKMDLELNLRNKFSIATALPKIFPFLSMRFYADSVVLKHLKRLCKKYKVNIPIIEITSARLNENLANEDRWILNVEQI